MQQRVYFHSPFSEASVLQKEEKFLLLSFVLSELFSCNALSENQWFFHQDTYSIEELSHGAPLNKLLEHTDLLIFAFPKQKDTISQVKDLLFFLRYKLAGHKKLQETTLLKKIFLLLSPLLEEGQCQEHFIFFLLQHQEEIADLSSSNYLVSLLKKIYPQGLSSLETFLADYFHQRGFSFLIPKVKDLIEKVKKDKVA